MFSQRIQFFGCCLPLGNEFVETCFIVFTVISCSGFGFLRSADHSENLGDSSSESYTLLNEQFLQHYKTRLRIRYTQYSFPQPFFKRIGAGRHSCRGEKSINNARTRTDNFFIKIITSVSGKQKLAVKANNYVCKDRRRIYTASARKKTLYRLIFSFDFNISFCKFQYNFIVP